MISIISLFFIFLLLSHGIKSQQFSMLGGQRIPENSFPSLKVIVDSDGIVSFMEIYDDHYSQNKHIIYGE